MVEVSPEAELALLLTATRVTRDRMRARIAELAELIDEDAFVTFLRNQRMVLLGGTRLAEIAPHAPSGGFHRRLAQARAEAHAGALLFVAASRHLTDALEREGILAVELKGAALAEDLHGDSALRAYADIDVLVPVERLDDAVSIAGRLGWIEPASSMPAELHRSLDHPEGALPVLELHWRVHWYETRFAEDMLERSRLVDGVRRLEPLDQLAALLAFYARDGFNGLRLPADIGAWWDRYGDVGVPQRLVLLATTHADLGEAWRAAWTAVSPLVGLPTAELRPHSRRAALASRLRNWDLRGDVDQIKANVSLVDGLLSPRAQFGAFVRRYVFLSASELSNTYGMDRGSRARVASWRVWHAAKIAVRYTLALARVGAGRSWSRLPASLGSGR